MSALANLTANDATPVTPVAYTFTPAGKTKDGYWIFEQSTPAPSNALAAVKMHVRLVRAPMSQSEGSKLGGAARIHAKLWYPIMETVSTNDAGITPPPQVAYTIFIETNYVFPERSTAQERTNARALGQNLISFNQILVDVVKDLRDLY